MLYTIACVDRPDAGSLRADTRPAHMEYLQARSSKIVLAGATMTDDGATMTGSMIIINATDRAEADAFSAHDPFTKAGLFASVTINRMRKGIWNPATGDAAE